MNTSLTPIAALDIVHTKPSLIRQVIIIDFMGSKVLSIAMGVSAIVVVAAVVVVVVVVVGGGSIDTSPITEITERIPITPPEGSYLRIKNDYYYISTYTDDTSAANLDS